jgi:hypothetical protein
MWRTILIDLLETFLAWLKTPMNINIAPSATPDPLPEATAGLKLADTIAGGVVQVDKEENTPANNLAAIEDHKLKVDQAAQKALEEGDVATLQKMWQAAAKLIALALVLLNLQACSGLNHQNMIEDSAAPTGYYDPSTPPQYPTAFDSGVLDIIKTGNKRTVIITSNKSHGLASAQPYIDRFGNHVFSVDGSVPLGAITAQQDGDAAKLESAK